MINNFIIEHLYNQITQLTGNVSLAIYGKGHFESVLCTLAFSLQPSSVCLERDEVVGGVVVLLRDPSTVLSQIDVLRPWNQFCSNWDKKTVITVKGLRSTAVPIFDTIRVLLLVP